MNEYEFASGVINVLEKKVFDNLDQQRMLNAPDQKAAWQVLFDTDLGQWAGQEKDLEKIFENDLSCLKKTLEKLTQGESQIILFLFLKFEALNLKLALKNKFAPERTGPLTPFAQGLTSWPQLTALVEGKAKSELNPWAKTMAENVLNELLASQAINSALIEKAVDAAYFKTKLALAGKNKLLKEITEIEIDLANLKSALTQDNCFLEGGNLSQSDLKKLLVLKEGEIILDWRRFSEIFALSLLLEKFFKTKSAHFLEKGLQSFIAQTIFQRAREKSFGLSKVLAFFQKKLNAQNNIRLILFAKENNLETAEIENRLLPL